MKFYLYISDAKVDMLLPQIPHDVKKKTAVTFGLDLKVLKAERQSESETEDNRITRLEAVVSFIRDNGPVGSVDAPQSYIYDTLALEAVDMETEAEAGDGSGVYFSGQTARTMFGLAGSSKHLLGSEGLPDSFSRSTLHAITKWLRASARLNETPLVARRMYDAVYDLAVQSLRSQRLEFLARQLAFCKDYRPTPASPQKNVLLATPLYIAMTD